MAPFKGIAGTSQYNIISDSGVSVSTENLDNSQIPDLSSEDELSNDEEEDEPLAGFGEYADSEKDSERKKIQFECYLKTKSEQFKNFKAVVEG